MTNTLSEIFTSDSLKETLLLHVSTQVGHLETFIFRWGISQGLHLLGITKLDKEKNQCIRGKQEHRT